jgi:protein TonB
MGEADHRMEPIMDHGKLVRLHLAALALTPLLALNTPALAQGAPCKATAIAGTDISPSYPLKARRLGERGTVDVQVTVTPEGAPSNVAIAKTSGSETLDEAALDNVRSRFWKPRDGCAAARMIVRISYEMTHKVGNPGEDFYIWRW